MDVKKLLTLAASLWVACSQPPPELAAPTEPPSILLVTLDTTRADSTGLESEEVETPHLEALALRGITFTQAYTTAPVTLPAHTSMMTGLYPQAHGIRENARYLDGDLPLLAGRLQEEGYRTAAFLSALPLAGRFGLARGFDHYDDDFGDAAERDAGQTTERALAYLSEAEETLFLWVHFFDPHEPYDPPEPYASRYESPYLGEIAYMDQELGRLVAAFAERGTHKILVVGDHGEGLGDHGEMRHGNLLYQGVMRVPLIAAGTGIEAGERKTPVSVRRVYDTVLAWAGIDTPHGLLQGAPEVVIGEAMKPFLQYGWQPQVMAVYGDLKMIRSGETEIYDIRSDPAEAHNLEGRVEVDRELAEAIRAYPFLPRAASRDAARELSRDDRERLASLGYAGGPEGQTAYRADAPSPRRMSHLFAALDAASEHFVRGEYERAVAIFEDVAREDPGNPTVQLRLAVAHSALGRDREALAFFERAQKLAPSSPDVEHYLAMHHLRFGRSSVAAPLFETVLARTPERLPALEGLARIRENEGRLDEMLELLERIVARKPDPRPELLKVGEVRMARGETEAAVLAFEQARRLAPEAFSHALELGVLYLAAGRYREAGERLDEVGPEHPGRAMALFKRAQVSVLLGEENREERIRRAFERADEVTRPLILSERLFEGVRLQN